MFTRFPSWNPKTWLGSPKSKAPWCREIVHFGVNLNCPAHTTTGVLCARAAVAAREQPDVAKKPPFARIACAPMMTLFTRDIIANIDESGTRNVDIPADERDRAIIWPLYLLFASLWILYTYAYMRNAYDGAVSATMTVNRQLCAADFRKASTVRDTPMVSTISL